jgi:hypothetical protein
MINEKRKLNVCGFIDPDWRFLQDTDYNMKYEDYKLSGRENAFHSINVYLK